LNQPLAPPLFIGSQIYRQDGFEGPHPLAIPRVPTVLDLCRTLGWLPDTAYQAAPRARAAALTAFHTPTYVAALQKAEQTQCVDAQTRARHQIGTASNPIYPRMFARPATSVGGSLLATDLIANGGVVFNPGGGTHHGMPDRAAGFCFFNDPVLAILALRKQGLRRIVYVDIDAHHCDGVQEALAGIDGIRLISTHEERRWPFTGDLDDHGAGTVFNLPLPRGLNDTEFDLIIQDLILPAVASHRPDAIVLQCGADAVAEDPLSRLTLSNNCHWTLVEALRPMAPRLLVLGGGGYNPWSVARLWTGVWATLAGHDIPAHLPDTAQSVLRALHWSRSAGRNPPEHWFTTLRDTPNPGAIRDDIRQRTQMLASRLRRQV